MKKSLKLILFAVLALFISSFLLNFISAYSSTSAGYFLRTGSEQVIDGIVGFAEPFLQVLLGGAEGSYNGQLLFERFLLFVLLLSMIYVSISRTKFFEDQKVVVWIIAIAVPLIAIRFINFIWLNTILMQYGVLGIAITAILPFIIYLFFLHGVSDSDAVRKIGWIFFIAVYIGLWITSDAETYAQIYFWTMVVAFVFLLLDGTIHRWYIEQQLKNNDIDKWEYMGRLRKQIRETKDLVAHGDLPPERGEKLIRAYKRSIKRMNKY